MYNFSEVLLCTKDYGNCVRITILKILFCSQRVYSNYERGDIDIPTSVLIRLASLYDVSTDYILGLTNYRKRYPKIEQHIDNTTAMNMSFQRGYAERFDWLKQQFTDWIFVFSTSLLYYEGSDDEETKELFRQAMAACDGNAPTYHIELRDKPTMVWDFHSLLLMIQMMFSTMLTDSKNPLRLCKHCNKVFEAKRPDNLFYSAECKNRFNVYKSRNKDK